MKHSAGGGNHFRDIGILANPVGSAYGLTEPPLYLPSGQGHRLLQAPGTVIQSRKYMAVAICLLYFMKEGHRASGGLVYRDNGVVLGGDGEGVDGADGLDAKVLEGFRGDAEGDFRFRAEVGGKEPGAGAV